jgi:hypothetical protein
VKKAMIAGVAVVAALALPSGASAATQDICTAELTDETGKICTSYVGPLVQRELVCLQEADGDVAATVYCVPYPYPWNDPRDTVVDTYNSIIYQP